MGKPSVHPMGTIIYKPEKCFNGYTVFQAAAHGATLIDMNGGVVNHWAALQGFPNKLVKGGYVFGSRGERDTRYGCQDQKDLILVDWDGNVVWEFNKLEYIEDPDNKPQWMARQHHDFQREGNPVGYYVPGMECKADSGNTLILCHYDDENEHISNYPLLSDCFIEVDYEGNIVWQWKVDDHFDELGFDEDARKAIKNREPEDWGAGRVDWMHINSMSYVGPNKWYDAGDERFHPDNIIWDGRETNIIAIISKETGKIVWKLGPDYSQGKAKEIGQIIGQHHAHVIPKGLPGEGNILIFDNGGQAGYGAPNPMSENGAYNCVRDYSRVLEIDPTTMEIVWQCRPKDLGEIQPMVADHFYSNYISSAQRLPNGNTLITQGEDGRLFEITPSYEIVWEYISPYFGDQLANMVYRAYRYPYDYVPQIPVPVEKAIAPVDNTDFRLPNAKSKEFRRMVHVEGVDGYGEVAGFCLPIDNS